MKAGQTTELNSLAKFQFLIGAMKVADAVDKIEMYFCFNSL